MRVRVFGGVDVVLGDRVIELGHSRQRCVLAVLIAQANQPVSADDLVDQVWGDHPPPHARDAVYTYISRLRAALATAPDVLITHDTRGYRLVVDDTAIDLHRFRALVAQARADTDAHSALTLLDQALAMARGEPFADLDSTWLADRRTAAMAERYAAELDRTDLALRCGRYTGLVADLTVRVAEHPLDERLAGQYLLALYRTGRQADAITHHQRIRTTLATQSGSRPTPALQAIYQQILTGDGAVIRTSSPSAPIPRQLPPTPAWFTGREPELAALTRLVDAAVPAGRTVVISAIVGTGGIGKTWLALHWAYQHLDQFPDGQLFVDLHGFTPTGQPVTPADAIRGFLDGLGVPPDQIPADLDAQTALYRRTVGTKRMLIVLDNAADAEQVTPLLPGSHTCTVLVTSRRRLLNLATGQDVRRVLLGVLTDTEARDLLAARLGAERVATEAAAVETLLACCAGFPLALGIVIGRALTSPDVPLAVLAAELGDSTQALEALDTGEAMASLPAVLSWSVRALSADQARVFGLLGVAPGSDISLPAAAALTALSTSQTCAVLGELEIASLLQQPMPGRYRMHDLIRHYAADTTNDDLTVDVRQAALRRVLDFYTHTAYAADRLLAPQRPSIALEPPAPGVHGQQLADVAAALAWLDTEHPVLLAAQRTAAGHGWHSTVWQLAWALDNFHYRRGHHHDQLAVWQTALPAAEHLSDAAARGFIYRTLGNACAELGRYEEGIRHLHQALALAENEHDTGEQARTHRGLTMAWDRCGDNEQALRHATYALELVRALNRPVAEADALNMVGWCAARLGHYDVAHTHCLEALMLLREHHYPDGEAQVLDSLGYIAGRTGQHQRAIDYLQEALTLRRALGNVSQAATNLDSLGHSYVALGDSGQARTVWWEALRLYRDQGRDTEADLVGQQLDALDRPPSSSQGENPCG